MSEKIQVESFYKYLISNGYYFDKELIENYLLSLKVKPFEILTGNSGTGKTKLSQLFAHFINFNKNNGQYVKVKGKVNYASWDSMSWTLDKKYFLDFLPIRNCESNFKMLVDGISADGRVNVSIQLDYFDQNLKNDLFEIWNNLPEEYKKKYSKKGPELDILIDVNDIKNFVGDYSLIEESLKFTKNATETAAKDRQWQLGNEVFEYFPFKWGKMDTNIIVNGIKSKAKIRALLKLSYSPNEKLQEYLKENQGKKVNIDLNINNSEFGNFVPNFVLFDENYNQLRGSNDVLGNHYIIVPVGANWTDNTNIVGYYNAITEDYQSTPAYELIKQAQNDPENPYFLILDEMNLSHVERYFADFLSAIESGEEIPLYGDDEKLKLPDNLFIIGTVNVDETTYMFSPKVLDRANTIEFDTLLAWDYMLSEVTDDDFNGNIDYLQSPLEDSDISDLNIEDLKGILSQINDDDDNLWDTLAMELTEFQKALKGSGFDFGFRVINEILRFMIVAWRYENEPEVWDNWERYFDAQIKQKILPKLHGSEKAIGNVLIDLFNICLDDRNNNENPKLFEVTHDNSRYYTSALKLQSMVKVLSDQRYVSFIN